MHAKHACGAVLGMLLPWMALPGETKAGDKPLVVGFSLPLLGYPMMADMKKAAEAEAESLGVKLRVTDAHFGLETQINDLGRLVEEHVDGILVSPMPFGSLAPAIDAAVGAGVPVVRILGGAEDKAIATWDTDTVQGGRMAARFIVEKLGGKGSVLVLEGKGGFQSQFRAAFDEELKRSSARVLASTSTDLYRGMAKQAMVALIGQNPRFDAVLAVNDTLALGAIDALIEAGIDPSTKLVVGWDATPEALQAIDQRKLGATFSQQVDEQTRQGLRCLVEYIRTKKAPAAKYLQVAPKLITKQD